VASAVVAGALTALTVALGLVFLGKIPLVPEPSPETGAVFYVVPYHYGFAFYDRDFVERERIEIREGETVTLSIGRFGTEPCTDLQRSMTFQVVSATELQLTAASGQVCNPFTGAVMNVTSGSGTLRKE